jgi:hypothetical protein
MQFVMACGIGANDGKTALCARAASFPAACNPNRHYQLTRRLSSKSRCDWIAGYAVVQLKAAEVVTCGTQAPHACLRVVRILLGCVQAECTCSSFSCRRFVRCYLAWKQISCSREHVKDRLLLRGPIVLCLAVANSFGTSVGAKTISLKQACMVRENELTLPNLSCMRACVSTISYFGCCDGSILRSSTGRT